MPTFKKFIQIKIAVFVQKQKIKKVTETHTLGFNIKTIEEVSRVLFSADTLTLRRQTFFFPKQVKIKINAMLSA